MRQVIWITATSLLLACASAPRTSTVPRTAPAVDEPGRPAPASSERRAEPPRRLADEWRSVRWGMSVDEVLEHAGAQAFRVDPALTLADGMVVAAGIDRHRVGALELQVRFVFGRGGLALVSVRTPPTVYAEPSVFDELASLMRLTDGEPVSSSWDSAFIDMRQATWEVGGDAIDLKYIPGVVVLLYRPAAIANQR